MDAEFTSRSCRFHSRSFQIAHDHRDGYAILIFQCWPIIYLFVLNCHIVRSLGTIVSYDLYVRSYRKLSITIMPYDLYVRSQVKTDSWVMFSLEKRDQKLSLLWNEINYNYFEYVDFIFTNKFVLCLLLDVRFCYCLTHFVSWTLTVPSLLR